MTIEARKRRIMVVDDDPELRLLLERYLERYDFDVLALGEAKEVDRRLSRYRPDALVLDVMLPGEDGLSLCKRLRSRGELVPILMLTARDEPLDRILGLELGADEYLGKPFEPRELVARLEALLRRARLPAAAPEIAGVVRIGEWGFERDTRQLKALTDRPYEPLRRERLLALARDADNDVNDRAIDVQVSRLRKRLEHDPRTPRFIQTVWGVGYVFVPDTKPSR